MENQVDLDAVDPDVWLKNEDYFMNIITDPVNRNRVPLLNANALHVLQDNKLVRFRGMIQDMHNPEFYFESFEIVNKVTKVSRLNSGKYRDTADIGENELLNYTSSNLKSADRQTFSVISLPAFNKWAQNVEKVQNITPHLIHPPSTSRDTLKLKRSLDQADNNGDDMDTSDHSDIPNKDRRRNTNITNQNSAVSHEHILNFPLPDSTDKLCLIKVYSGYEDFKLNDMVEILGFLSVNPALCSEWNNKTDDDRADDIPHVEVLTHNPPPSLVPRIHAVRIDHLKHCNPLFEQPNKDIAVLNEAREHLRTALTQVLFGDTLAADYLICHLLSRVYLRRDDLTLGKFSLNLSNIPCQLHPNYPEQLYSIFQEFVTKSYYLPLTIDNLNTFSFLPKKDYECNRLTSGVLQLSQNTHLVLDETKMSPGQLNGAGVENLAALGNMIQTQKNKYDFKFYKMDYDCDIPVLVLSEGKSLLPSDFHLPIVTEPSCLEIVNEIIEAAKHYLNNDILNKIRTYVTMVQLSEYTIDEEPTYIQDDFLIMRKVVDGIEQKASAQDLHNLLVLARLVGLSRGYHTLNRECWDMAKNMEEQRWKRIQK